MPTQKKIGFVEFVLLMAATSILVSFAIDAMLPALPAIGADLHPLAVNDRQLVIPVFFFGMATAQIVIGPLADSYGRRPVMFSGMALFILGCLWASQASGFYELLAARLMQGIGAAAPRVTSIAITRDLYSGREMARVSSLTMVAFMMGPMAAPAVGQVFVNYLDWRALFVGFAAICGVVWLWAALRLPETAPNRGPLSLGAIKSAFAETLKNRKALGYTLASGFTFGGLMAYLSSAQQILQEMYALGDYFALAFGGLAGMVAIASFANASLVRKYGMRRICAIALAVMVVCSGLFLAYSLWLGVRPPLTATLSFLAVFFFCAGMLFGNFSALAMEPLGHIAGAAASVIGCISMSTAAVIGAMIARAFNGTIMPVLFGFAACALGASASMRWAERGR